MDSSDTKIRVLSSEGPDREAWLQAWGICGREPFAHPAYVELFASGDEQACAAVAESAKGLVLLPLVLRPICGESWASRSSLRDGTSPYGYGGPYGDRDGITSEFWSVLAQWMSAHEIVSMFGRLALGAPTPSHLPPGVVIGSDSDNVVVDLARSSEDQWRHYEHKVRKNVKKATRANLQVDVKPAFSDLEEFVRLYNSTMDRREASSWYYFGLDFFDSLTRSLDGSYLAAEVRDDRGRLVSAELTLTSDNYLYSFLGGTLQEAFPQAPNDLLKHTVIDYGRAAGRIGFVLGGGYTRDDGIIRYKKSFDPTGCVPFNKLRLIADQSNYDSLVAERLTQERSTSPLARLTNDFFPTYRGGILTDEQ